MCRATLSQSVPTYLISIWFFMILCQHYRTVSSLLPIGIEKKFPKKAGFPVVCVLIGSTRVISGIEKSSGASKNKFAEGHSRGPRTAGLGLFFESFLWNSRIVFLVSLFGPSLVRDMPWSRPRISRSIFSGPSWFPVVWDYWSSNRRDPIATANSVKFIVESSWFLKKVDLFQV